MSRYSSVKLLVFALVFFTLTSDAATTLLVDHANQWHYHKGTNAPVADWRVREAGDLDATWRLGPGGFGYADGDDATVLTDMRNLYTTVFIRQEFTLESPVDPAAFLSLVVNYDDGFVAYLDGAEVARANAPGAVGSAIAHTAVANANHEAGTAVTYSLGAVSSRLSAGVHILALIGLNDAADSSDLTLIADLSVGDPPGNTIWYRTNSPIVLSNGFNVPSGATLTIEPGVTVLFGQGASLSVGGQLFALGESANRITFTRNTGATSWGEISFSGNSLTSYIAHADLNFSSGNIAANGTTLFLQDLTWSNTTGQLVDLVGCSITLMDCFIPGGFGNEPIHFSSFPANGHALIKGNFFGAPAGYNDSIDFTGGNRPGPIAQFIDNVFLAAVDDCLDLDGTDAHIEGNIFINVHQDAARASSANAISTGADGGNTSELIIVRNLFFDVDHALLLKDSGSAVFQNNTVVNIRSNQFSVVPAACVNFGEPHRGAGPARGLLADGNIFWDVHAEAPFLNLDDTMFMVMNRTLCRAPTSRVSITPPTIRCS